MKRSESTVSRARLIGGDYEKEVEWSDCQSAECGQGRCDASAERQGVPSETAAEPQRREAVEEAVKAKPGRRSREGGKQRLFS
jgi:hypothetical protein